MPLRRRATLFPLALAAAAATISRLASHGDTESSISSVLPRCRLRYEELEARYTPCKSVCLKRCSIIRQTRYDMFVFTASEKIWSEKPLAPLRGLRRDNQRSRPSFTPFETLTAHHAPAPRAHEYCSNDTPRGGGGAAPAARNTRAVQVS